MTFFFTVAGLIAGAALLEWGGALLGAALGFVLARVIVQQGRLSELERQFRDLRLQWPAVAPGTAPRTADRAAPAHEVAASPPQPMPAPAYPPPAPAPGPEPAIAAPVTPPAAAPPSVFEALIARSGRYFTTGNVVAKVGATVLFFGVAFLLKYAAQRGLVPIEWRLAGVALGAAALLGFGWRLRARRPQYAAILQGAGVGVLYLTVFAALRLYRLVPAGLAFTMLVAIVVSSGVLAVLQSGPSLAVLGTAGGFLAPILTSGSSGNHVALFSYYLVLNLGVLGIAWFRAWRVLNWVGFLFTFVIATIWGVTKYEPRHFSSTEPFLIASFLFYLAVTILFAERQPPRLRGYLDGTLVFGLPVIVFALQEALVREIEFGRALSAAGMSAIYLLAARLLWPRHAHMRMLAEAFLALGVVFATLAVPFALDGHWTAALWALEGAGLVWIGVRQRRVLARSAGAALQLASGLAFLAMTHAQAAAMPVFNTAFIGAVVVALAAVFSAREYARAQGERKDWEAPIEIALVIWALAWWFGAGGNEIDRYAPHVQQQTLAVGYVSASGLLLAAAAQRWNWTTLMFASAIIGPLLSFIALIALAGDHDAGPLIEFRWAAWPVGLTVTYILLWRFENIWPPVIRRAWHADSAVLLIGWAAWCAEWLIARLDVAGIWQATAWGAAPALAVLAIRYRGAALPWPIERHATDYHGWIPALLLVWAGVWALWACFEPGTPRPLPYLPLANPLELTQAAILVAAVAWSARTGRALTLDASARRASWMALAAFAFLIANCILARAVHHYTGTDYTPGTLHRSAVFHTALSIFWALLSATTMYVASRRRARGAWLAGAGLLGFLVLKLFSIDLGSIGTIARIVSFIATGVLILLIGYLAPVPPRAEQPA